MNRRMFLGAALSVAAADGERTSMDQIQELTLDQIRKHMLAGRWTARSLAQTYLRAIATGDKNIKSVIELDAGAPAVAASLDRELREKGPRGPLHGVPIVLKDNIDTAGPLHTTSGSLAL